MKMRYLLIGSFLVIWCAAVSGYSLQRFPDLSLGLHLATGVGGLLPISLFLTKHWWIRRKRIGRHPNTVAGYATLACLTGLTLSGLALLVWTNYRPFIWIHTGTTIALALGLTVHFTWRLRKRWFAIGHRPWGRYLSSVVIAKPGGWLLLGSLALVLLPALPRLWITPAQPAEGSFVADIPLVHDSVDGYSLVTAADCYACHEAIKNQWQATAHANAATNPYYGSLVGLFIQERGVEASRFCAPCHNPVGLVYGEVAVGVGGEEEESMGQDHAYQARALNTSLFISAQAAEGVTCVICHQAREAGPNPGNGSLMLGGSSVTLPQNALDRLRLRVEPAQHGRDLLPTIIGEAQLCGSCHNLYGPNGLALEPTYDEWLDSPYPDDGITCQSCHMPPVEARPVNSTLSRDATSHGGRPGKPSSLPGVADDVGLLQEAATIGAHWQMDDGMLQVTAIITNTGAGHHLPTGASDLRQMWLAATLRDANGKIVWQTGALDEYGTLDAGSVQFRKVLGDANGRVVELHRIWVATQVLSDTTLAPLETRRIPFQIPLTQLSPLPYSLNMRLLYRDVPPQFAEFALSRPARDLPVWEMAATTVLIPEFGNR